MPPDRAPTGGAGLLASVFSRHWLDAEATALWTDRATMRAWVEVEVALAAVQAELGLIPAESARRIAAAANADRIDLDRVARDTARTLHPFVPVLRQIEEQCGEPAAGYLHWGATTQNIFDTGAALQLKRSHTLLIEGLDEVLASLAALAVAHAGAVQAGRTHGQHALPITFGLKVAGWLDELRRHRERFAEIEKRAFAAAMGGAVGAFAAMEGKGREVQARLATRLGLADAGVPSRASGDRLAEYVGLLAQFGATCERIARDIVFLQRTEIGEVAEAFHLGKVGSSTMAQKRNPSVALNLIGMATLLRGRAQIMTEGMVRLDEGDAGLSNACDATLPEAAVLGVSLARSLARLVAGLEVDAAAMEANLGRSRGLIMTEAVMMRLGPIIGRHRAHELLYEAAMEAFERRELLLAVLSRHPALASIRGELPALLDPANYVAEAAACARESAAARPGARPSRHAAE